MKILKILKFLINAMLSLPMFILAILVLCSAMNYTTLAIFALIESSTAIFLCMVVGICQVITKLLEEKK